MTVSVCVIGGGAVGLSAAVELTRRGIRDVMVLEAEDLAAGSSSRSGGFVESQYVDPLDVELRARSMHTFRRLQRDEGLDIREIGYLRLARSTEQLAAFEASVRIQRELGIDHARVLDAAAVRRLVPLLRADDVAGGLWGPRDGRIDGPAYCRLLARLAASGGARIRTHSRVVGAVRTGGGWRLETDAGAVTADVIVLAAGAWAGPLGTHLGVSVPVLPVRNQIVILRLERSLEGVLPMVMDYIPHTGERGLYVASYDDASHVLAGLHSEEVVGEVVDPDRYARDADPEYVQATRERLAMRFPELSVATVARAWAGLYPISTSGQPIVGPAPGASSVILAVGGGGSGIQLSPIMGALAADWVAPGHPRSMSDGMRLAPTRLPWRVRAAAGEDIAAVRELAVAAWRDTYAPHLSRATIDQFLDRAYAEETLARRISGPAFLLAENDRGLAAFAEATNAGDHARLVAIYAHPARRGEGAGSALLDAIRSRWPGRPIAADVLLGNELGERFYAARGFEPRERLHERLGNETIVERRWWLKPGAQRPASPAQASSPGPAEPRAHP